MLNGCTIYYILYNKVERYYKQIFKKYSDINIGELNLSKYLIITQ